MNNQNMNWDIQYDNFDKESIQLDDFDKESI